MIFNPRSEKEKLTITKGTVGEVKDASFSLSADKNEDWDWIVRTNANKQTKTPHPTEMEISPLSLRAVHTSPKYSNCIR